MAQEQEREEGQERPSRPVTAAARRERRASARPAARKDAGPDAAESGSSPKGKADTAARKDGKAVAKTDGKATVDAKGRPTPTRDNRSTRGSFPGRIVRFLREVVAELRKVIWPTRKQMMTYWTVVLVFVAFMVALVYGFDWALVKGVTALFGN